jgi:glycosyltransferase involved in cell wall biosynthesis
MLFSRFVVPSPRVTICIPTFERLTYLREAVASARAQTSQDIEILIGDDGNSSDLRAWCLAQAAEDGRVRYQKTPRRLGLAGNWNFLAGLASGDYLTLIGDDDRLLSNFVDRLLSEVASADIAVAFSNHYVIDSRGNRSSSDSRDLTARYGRSELKPGLVDDAARLVWRNAVPMLASIVRTRDVRRLAFKTDINTPELELFVRMAAEGARFAFVDDYLAEYRVHSGSATSGGLTVDRLAEYLEAVDVPPQIEALKRECLEPLLVGGVGIRLTRGDIEGARALRASQYFPRSRRSPRIVMQGLMFALPSAWVRPAYVSLGKIGRSIQRARNWLAS